MSQLGHSPAHEPGATVPSCAALVPDVGERLLPTVDARENIAGTNEPIGRNFAGGGLDGILLCGNNPCASAGLACGSYGRQRATSSTAPPLAPRQPGRGRTNSHPPATIDNLGDSETSAFLSARHRQGD